MLDREPGDLPTGVVVGGGAVGEERVNALPDESRQGAGRLIRRVHRLWIRMKPSLLTVSNAEGCHRSASGPIEEDVVSTPRREADDTASWSSSSCLTAGLMSKVEPAGPPRPAPQQRGRW